MGPHFFKCGKESLPSPFAPTHPRFNGAALFQVRKGEMDKNRRRNCLRFNGAALFQVRKAAFVKLDGGEVFGFNGAALFQVRKVTRNWQPVSGSEKLQWGRTFSSAERSHRFR